MIILGVQDGINASACLLVDGVLVRAIQEERMTGVKEQTGFPFLSVKRILELEGLPIDDIDEMALATQYATVFPAGVEGRTAGISVAQKLKDLAPAAFGVYEDNVPVLKAKVPELFRYFERRRNAERLARIREKLGYYGPIAVVEHHIAHAASGYYSSPWRDGVLVLSKDASGDGLCATVNVGNGGTFERIAQTVHTHSLGYLYTGVTGFMGMRQHSHEYKLMGMAPYAPERYAERPYEAFGSYIGLGDNPLEFRRKVPEPLHHIKPRLMDDLYMQRFDGIAAGLQRLTEELMVSWVRNAMLKTGLRLVTAGGGVFMNVVVNKLIREMHTRIHVESPYQSSVEGFFPMPSAGDESTSIGAAQWVYAQRMLEAGQEPRVEPLGPLYLGDEPTEREIDDAMDDTAAMAGQFGDKMTGYYGKEFTDAFDVQHSSHVDDLAADLILKGEIVARCRGRMEFGARALGNRSILCDASDLRNVGVINRAIKSRDFWMPFAPVVDSAWADVYFKNPAPAPYMTTAFDTTPAAREDLIAALHQANFSARPQILEPGWNDGVYDILAAFQHETDRGGMLNTSFNLHGSPIVHGAKEALHTFLNSGLKHLVLGDYLLSKRGGRQ